MNSRGKKNQSLHAVTHLCFLLVIGTFIGFLSNEARAFDVTLGWDPNTESNLAGYRIHYDTDSGPPYRYSIEVALSTPDFNRYSPGYTVTGLAEGVRYYFVLTAYNDSGLESGYSNEVSAQSSSTSPPPPQNVAPVSSGLQVNGQSGSTFVYTNNRIVTVQVVASDDVLVHEYLILDGKSDPSGGMFLTIPGGPRQNAIFTITGFVLNNFEGNRTIYAWVKDDQGLLSAAALKTNVVLDRMAPLVTGFPAVNYTDSSLTITYSENNMRNAASASNYTLDQGLLIEGNGADISGSNRVFRLPLNPETLQPHNIYNLQISGAVTDAAGNAVTSNIIRVNDDDNDGMADNWEIRNGLNPVSGSDRDLDLDRDGWTNYEEYLYGTAANDPGSKPQSRNVIEVIEVVPVNNAGMAAEEKGLQDNTGFSVRIESTNGLNMNDPDAVTFTVADGAGTYTRKLNDLNSAGAGILRAAPLDADGNNAYSFWAVYYRTNETAIPKNYPAGSVIEVTVKAGDRLGEVMAPLTFCFKIQSEEEKNEETAKLPVTSVRADSVSGTKTVTVESGPLEGASIIFPIALQQETGVEPLFGPVEDIPPLTGTDAVGAPLNLLPEMVFPSPVTLLIPCPGYDDLTNLEIYYYDGRDWWLACDREGNVTPYGEGWMVPGSRVNHPNGKPSTIEIKVYHFSAVIAGREGSATTPKGTVTVNSGGGGGGCFINTALE